MIEKFTYAGGNGLEPMARSESPQPL